MPVTDSCPLCEADDAADFHADGLRCYLRCRDCGLVFVPPAQRLSRAAELGEYLKHDNRLDVPGYRRFLSRLADPLLAHLAPASEVLDSGSGASCVPAAG